MRVLFENEQNGLWAEFSTDTPLMFLEKINGNSCGCKAVTYEPLEFDGQRFISANLTARTVELSVNFGGKSEISASAGDEEAAVFWAAVSGASMYRVYSTTDSGKTFERVYTAYPPEISTVITGLSNGTEYGFAVRSKVGEEWSDYSDIVYVTPAEGAVLKCGAAGRYSRKKALARWEEIQRVFVPGQYGRLTWTDGENSRFIRCRTSETPALSEILPFLFGAKFELVADLPLWFDTVENEVVFKSGQTVINNPCGLTVPFCVDIPAGAGAFILNNLTSGKVLKMLNTGESYTIDTAACTVTTSGGELVNNRLSVDSEFFGLVPGDNTFVASGSGSFELRWRKAYMGIGG